MASPFEGRVAVVTGGSAGIGLGVARALGGAGARVAVWARRVARSEDACRELISAGIDAIAVGCDVGDEDSVATAAETTLGAFGRVDIAVANAGRSSAAPLVDTSLANWNKIVCTNLTGAFLTFRACVRSMIEHGEGGALLAISSLAARGGYPGLASYCATKAGLEGLVRALAVELAPHRIRCNALLPGFTSNAYFNPDAMDERRGRAIATSIPAGRWGTPDDIGRAAIYLADPTLPYHTGASVVVDGGLALMPPENASRAALS